MLVKHWKLEAAGHETWAMTRTLGWLPECSKEYTQPSSSGEKINTCIANWNPLHTGSKSGPAWECCCSPPTKQWQLFWFWRNKMSRKLTCTHKSVSTASQSSENRRLEEPVAGCCWGWTVLPSLQNCFLLWRGLSPLSFLLFGCFSTYFLPFSPLLLPWARVS